MIPYEPVPTGEGGTLVLQDDGTFLEFNEDGIPLGSWEWEPEEEVWVFHEFPSPQSGNIPKTGDGGTMFLFALISGLVLFGVGISMRATLRKRGK